MSGTQVAGFFVALAAGAAGGLLTTLVALRAAPAGLVRTNVNGRAVPVVLGFGMAVGALAGVFALVGTSSTSLADAGIVTGIVGVMFAAGLYDDKRGDERARGFRGHLGALRSGVVTGGIVKIVAGGLAGLLATLAFGSPLGKVEAFLLVPLVANLFNLLDRAPGRAAKAAWVLTVPLLAFGSASWAVAAAGLLGALVAAGPFDLRERAMLGDAGANPLGAVLGFGLAVSLPEPFLGLAVIVVLALTLVSERVSFSTVIDTTPWLRSLDRIGRR